MINAATRRRYGMRERPVYRQTPRTEYRTNAMSESNQGKCRKCGATVYWVKTPKGKNVALNDDLRRHAGPVFDGGGNYHHDGGVGRTSHFSTCPGMAEGRDSGDQTADDRQAQFEAVCRAGANTWSLNELQALTSDLSRLVGIMERTGANAQHVRKTRELVQSIIRKGWSQ